MKKRYLILCHNGVKRSPTAKGIIEELAGESSIADAESSNFLFRLSDKQVKEYVEKYDRIIVMQRDIYEGLEKRGVVMQGVYCLDIEDKYERDSLELRKKLGEKLGDLLKSNRA